MSDLQILKIFALNFKHILNYCKNIFYEKLFSPLKAYDTSRKESPANVVPLVPKASPPLTQTVCVGGTVCLLAHIS